MAEPFRLGQATSLALDAEHGQVYWTGSLASQTVRGIHRLDRQTGSDVLLIDESALFVASLALDPVSEHLYWANLGGIWRSDLDGNNAQLIIPDAGNVASIVVAPVPEPGTLMLAVVAFALAWLAGGCRLSRRTRK